MNQFYRSAFLGMMFCVFAVFVARAQDFSITGTITDDQQTALESATVYVETVKDSTLITYTISDVDGKFSIEDQTDAKRVKLFISFTGFQH